MDTPSLLGSYLLRELQAQLEGNPSTSTTKGRGEPYQARSNYEHRTKITLVQPETIQDEELATLAIRGLTSIQNLRGLAAGHPRAAESLARHLSSQAMTTAQTTKRRFYGPEAALTKQRATHQETFLTSVRSQGADAIHKAEALRIDRELWANFRHNLGKTCARALNHNLGSHEDLVNKLHILMQREDKIHDWFGSSPGLWDLEDGRWETLPWDALAQARAFIEAWPTLKNLAIRLGREWGQQAASNGVPITKPVMNHELKSLGREGIEGYTLGNNLEDTVLQDLAWLADPLSESLFMERFADSRLLCREWKAREDVLVQSGLVCVADVSTETGTQQGPVIICIDTSGSMAGVPEMVAKALVLALAMTCAQSQRDIYLIAFSTQLRCIAMSASNLDLEAIGEFLAGAFHGGTDLRPALAKAVAMISESRWNKADLLVVSDFKVPKIMIKKSSELRPLQDGREARLHSLTIGPEPMDDNLHMFDEHWHFALDRQGRPAGLRKVD